VTFKPVCTRCYQDKSCMFNKSNKSKNGLQSRCRSCVRDDYHARKAMKKAEEKKEKKENKTNYHRLLWFNAFGLKLKTELK